QCTILSIPGIAPRIIFFAEINTAIAIWRQLVPHLKLVGTDVWRLLDINAGILTIYPETCELFTPHMLDYPKWQAVSFTKGCYLGQEIVVRAEHLGRTKRRLSQVQTLTKPRPMPGERWQETGVIVEVASLPEGGYRMLAVVMEEDILKKT
ncbi:MAG: folate-binding protein, partial [Gammaproteobacteria bacterium]